MRRSLSVFLAAVLPAAVLLGAGCAGPGYLNKKFTGPAALRMAVLPATVTFKQYEDFTDTEFIDRLDAVSGKTHECLAPADIRAKLADNRPYAEAVSKLFGIEYVREEYLEAPTLADIFSASELEFVRFCLDDADLVLVPVEFTITSTGDGMAGTAEYRIYDLASGTLVLENTHSAASDKRGGPGVMMVTKQLVTGIAADCGKYVLK